MSRVEKIEKEMLHQVSIIVQTKLRDPRIGFVTITKTKITPDLREARIYFTTIQENRPVDELEQVMNSAAGFVRKLLGEGLRMKFTPHIEFIFDDEEIKQKRIEDIIDTIHKEKENKDESSGGRQGDARDKSE